jgi:hypothetical protein
MTHIAHAEALKAAMANLDLNDEVRIPNDGISKGLGSSAFAEATARQGRLGSRAGKFQGCKHHTPEWVRIIRTAADLSTRCELGQLALRPFTRIHRNSPNSEKKSTRVLPPSRTGGHREWDAGLGFGVYPGKSDLIRPKKIKKYANDNLRSLRTAIMGSGARGSGSWTLRGV